MRRLLAGLPVPAFTALIVDRLIVLGIIAGGLVFAWPGYFPAVERFGRVNWLDYLGLFAFAIVVPLPLLVRRTSHWSPSADRSSCWPHRAWSAARWARRHNVSERDPSRLHDERGRNRHRPDRRRRDRGPTAVAVVIHAPGGARIAFANVS